MTKAEYEGVPSTFEILGIGYSIVIEYIDILGIKYTLVLEYFEFLGRGYLRYSGTLNFWELHSGTRVL